MSDVKLARQRLDDPDRVDAAMVTVDPGRDLDVLADYVTSFVPEAHALGTDDFAALDRAAGPFGGVDRRPGGHDLELLLEDEPR